MKLTQVILGQEAATEVFFRKDDGSAITVALPPKYEIRDFNDALVLSGYGAQDPYNLARWTAQFTLPDDVLIGNEGQKYKIVWSVKDSLGASYKESDYFSVVDNTEFALDEIDIPERIMLAKSFLNDSLVLPKNVNVDALSLRVVDRQDNLIFESGPISTTPTLINRKNQIFKYKSPTAIEAIAVPVWDFTPYQVQWTYEDGGESETTIHYMYAINSKVADVVRSVRSVIDKARNQPFNPALAFFDTDILNYLSLGISYFNSAKPTNTNFNVSTIPNEMYTPMIECVMYYALRAQLGAESQANFQFGGQSVTLDMDRTQWIESELGRIQSYLQGELPGVKRRWIRGGGGRGAPGVLGVNLSSSYNWSPPINSRLGLMYSQYGYRR